MVLAETIKRQIRQYIQATWKLESHWSEATWVEAAHAHLTAMNMNLLNVQKKQLRDSVRYYRYQVWELALQNEKETPEKGAPQGTPRKPPSAKKVTAEKLLP